MAARRTIKAKAGKTNQNSIRISGTDSDILKLFAYLDIALNASDAGREALRKGIQAIKNEHGLTNEIIIKYMAEMKKAEKEAKKEAEAI